MPKTESQGRIHTSTATVAVLPEAEEVDVEIDPDDLEIDVYRSSGPGGQSVNTTDSAVRITHKPSGIVVSMQDEKSQLQNKDKAMRVLRARLLEHAIADQQAEISAERKAQVGTGERSEKIRTYNFPQGRVTDHRIKHTSHNLEEVLGGALGEFTEALVGRGEAGQAGGPDRPRSRLRWRRAGSVARGARLGRRRARAQPGVESPRLDAELLLAEAHRGATAPRWRPSPEADGRGRRRRARFGAMVRRRVAREPVAYILGRKGFRG